eukprot:891344_1
MRGNGSGHDEKHETEHKSNENKPLQHKNSNKQSSHTHNNLPINGAKWRYRSNQTQKGCQMTHYIDAKMRDAIASTRTQRQKWCRSLVWLMFNVSTHIRSDIG